MPPRVDLARAREVTLVIRVDLSVVSKASYFQPTYFPTWGYLLVSLAALLEIILQCECVSRNRQRKLQGISIIDSAMSELRRLNHSVCERVPFVVNILPSCPVTDRTTKGNETCEMVLARFQKLTNKIYIFMKV